MSTPYVATSETSHAAAESIAPDTNRLRRKVWEAINFYTFGPWHGTGLTCDEVEFHTNLSHQTASARIVELKKRGEIIPLVDGQGNPVRRKTRSGRMAQVYVTYNVT